MKASILALAVAAALPAAAGAETAITVYSSAAPGTLDARTFSSGGEGAVVPGYALVREDRPFTLKAGRNTLRIDDVPAFIDPTTVSFASLTDPAHTRVIEQSFEFDLTSTAKLLSRYLGREITVEQARGQGVEMVSGTLVGTQGALILRQPDGSVRMVPNNAGVRLPSLPGGLISKPTLVWDVDAASSGTQKARFTYQTGGMTWWTDYNLTYSEPSPGACSVDVAAWVTLVNQSGASFDDARLKLVAGDVQRVQRAEYAMAKDRVYAAAAPEAQRTRGFEEKSFFEYHMYTLGRTTSLAQNSTKQIELFPAASHVGCEKALVYYGQGSRPYYYGSPVMDRDPGMQANKKVDVYLRLKNSAANHLGIPLPAGRIRVAQLDPADKSLEFVGEDAIGHTAREETVQVKLGSAFDVVGERRQVDFHVDTSAKWIEEEFEVKVRNRKVDQAVSVDVRESLYRWSNWTITRRSQDYVKEDSRTIRFPVRIAPNGEAVVRYTVRYTW
ncbi:MAG TPA: hypothetical protein VLL50_10495 [Usitatibacter sp.]|nr:hypothetical protein [Usitatibacter sp.]